MPHLQSPGPKSSRHQQTPHLFHLHSSTIYINYHIVNTKTKNKPTKQKPPNSRSSKRPFEEHINMSSLTRKASKSKKLGRNHSISNHHHNVDWLNWPELISEDKWARYSLESKLNQNLFLKGLLICFITRQHTDMKLYSFLSLLQGQVFTLIRYQLKLQVPIVPLA